jgi:hypothetical protein
LTGRSRPSDEVYTLAISAAVSLSCKAKNHPRTDRMGIWTKNPGTYARGLSN